MDAKNRVYVCIDLKSFYASVEAVERGMDPLTQNLVVADPSRGRGAICLAITPALKRLDVKNRCRLFEIPSGIEYVTALPRMKKYMQYSAKIYSVYLQYVSAEDMHVYSIDECFIDATNYLKLYGVTARQFAYDLRNAVFEQTGITATCGIGTNLFLAKVALDIEAKHSSDGVGYLDRLEYRRKIWRHRPITDVWNVGRGIAARLAKYGIYDMRGVACCDENILYKEFGANAEFLIDHAHGVEPCTIADIRAYKRKSRSLSTGQVLFSDYTYDDALTVVKEMADFLSQELAEKGLVTNGVYLSVGYSKAEPSEQGAKRSRRGGGLYGESVGGSKKLCGGYTRSFEVLKTAFIELFSAITDRNKKIRRLNLGTGDLQPGERESYDLFTDAKKRKKENEAIDTVVKIKQKFGKTAIFRGVDLKPEATALERSKLIGGHNGGEEEDG